MIGRTVKYKIGEYGKTCKGEVLDKYHGITPFHKLPVDYYIIKIKGQKTLRHVMCEKITEIVTYEPSGNTGPR